MLPTKNTGRNYKKNYRPPSITSGLSEMTGLLSAGFVVVESEPTLTH